MVLISKKRVNKKETSIVHYRCNRKICKKCSKNTRLLKNKFKKLNNNKIKYGNSYSLEYNGYLILKNQITGSYRRRFLPRRGKAPPVISYNNKHILKKTSEGCKADILYKPSDCLEDKWLPIQIKTTNESSNMSYKFSNCDNYDRYLMCCIYLKDSLIWLFNGSLCTNNTTLRISNNKYNKYMKYIIDEDNICSKLFEVYNDPSFVKVTLNQGLMPQTKNCRLELYYRELRKKLLPFLDIKDIEIDGSVVDVIINDMNVQDKTGYYRKGYPHAICINLNKNYGTFDNEKYRGPYHSGDNNYYWINLPGKWKITNFYFIPEHELIRHGYIQNYYSCGKTKLTLYPELINSNTEWANKYYFRYDNIRTFRQIF